MHQSPDNTDEIVRRVLAQQLHVPLSVVTDGFLWIEEVTPEDACWVLAAVQDAFNTQLFEDYVNEETVSKISTVRGLLAYVQARIEGTKANC